MVEQVGGEGVAQGVWRQGLGDAGHLGLVLDPVPEGLAGHLLAAQAGEEHVAGLAAEEKGSRFALVTLDPGDGFLAQGHQALLAALAEHLEHALAQVDLFQGQADQFGDAQAAGVEHFEHGAVAQADGVFQVGGFQQGFDIRLGQRLGQRPPQLRQVHLQGGVFGYQVLAQQEAVEAAQPGKETCRGASLVALAQAPGQVVEDEVATGLVRFQAPLMEPAVEMREVAAVSRAGVGGQAFLQPQGVEETVDQGMV
ncbi:hypothetical protein D3C84_713290 [compost metagenome]